MQDEGGIKKTIVRIFIHVHTHDIHVHVRLLNIHIIQ